MISPLFFDVHEDNAPFNRVCFVEATQEEYDDAVEAAAQGRPVPYFTMKAGVRVRFDLAAETVEGTDDVASVEDAEDKLLALVGPTGNYRSNPGSEAENAGALAIMIGREANTIARRTRRGAGNVVLCHPDVVTMLGGTYVSAKKPAKVGRWTAAGNIGDTYAVYTSDHMSKDRVYIAYVGSASDLPAHVIQTEDGLKLAVRGSNSDGYGASVDFINCLSISYPAA